MKDTTILSMNHITKIYGNGIMANEDVTLSVREGEIHALMGENGAGKSTLMKVLFGIEKPDGGEILLNGRPVQITNPTVALSFGIGMVHQHFMLVPSLTVAENLVLGSEPKKGIVLDYAVAIRDTEKIAKEYNLPVDPRAKVKDLPVGMKQRVEILKALYRGAKLLILDEPTAVLAPQETDELFRQLKHLRDQGHTIIFISHKLREIKEICDRITIMRAGRSVGVYDVSSITAEEISRLMVGRDFVEKIDKTPAKRGETVLEAKHVSYGFGEDRLSLQDVSFSVRGGEILGIAGVEGNGQRELVELISGLRPMEKGDILFRGKSIRGESILKLRNRKMAHIPQDRLLYGGAAKSTIRDNLISDRVQKKAFGPLLNVKRLNQLCENLIREFSVKCEDKHNTLGMLSGGNMQKVVAARELSGEVDFLIADQPSRGIDVGATKFIHQKILALRDKGTAVLLVSADLNEVMELSDSLMVMYDGEIVAYFPDASQVEERELGSYMLGLKKQSKEEIGREFHVESTTESAV
ncbi:ABC transporter ATP-binding protein [Ruthenibacterium lactatiformans]|uniref:ABC transporter ATP-binding protein n=1 Tax=Ruthenibacterium lactatiformans TaxID=1550024 RepID=UPI0026D258D6